MGIATEELGVGTYKNFVDNIIPRIDSLGYNTILVMAIIEHAYYTSFGYQVTSFFTAFSRCGTPDELNYMVDKAHEAGLFVLTWFTRMPRTPRMD